MVSHHTPNMPAAPPSWASISSRPTHGTATLTQVPSVIPLHKTDKEVFWVQQLVSQLPEFKATPPTLRPNFDDANGGDDVIIDVNTSTAIGVQVTELTYELWRRRSAQRERFVRQVLDELQRMNATSPEPVVATLHSRTATPDDLKLPDAIHVAKILLDSMSSRQTQTVVQLDTAYIILSPVAGQNIYVPSYNRIGIDVDIDQLPRSFTTYEVAVDYLAKRKAGSRSPWLLIWSSVFWRDKHFLGSEVLRHMVTAFAASVFSRVYFIESIDGQGCFSANLALHTLKGDGS